MSLIHIHSVSYSYPNPYKIIFDKLNLSIDSEWKTGLIAGNGRGKTTLLKLMNGQLEPLKGNIEIPFQTSYFPYSFSEKSRDVLSVIRDISAPFSPVEEEMRLCLAEGSNESISRYSILIDQFYNLGGNDFDGRIEKEFKKMKLSPDLLYRDILTLSGGERTKCLLIALFLKKDFFPLIDEPTNHMDIYGRQVLGEYLAQKNGFLLVSHDRYLLDICTDHILYLSGNDAEISKGNFSQWKRNEDLKKQLEERQYENIRREVKHLKDAAQQKRKWANEQESLKTKKADLDGSIDKGHIGALSAKMMKSSINIENRIGKQLTDRQKLLRDKEKIYPLKIDVSRSSAGNLLTVSDISIKYDEKYVIRNLSFVLKKGERIALVGPNGCGKTTIFNTICGEVTPDTGFIHKHKHINFIRVRQIPEWNYKTLAHLSESENLDSAALRNILAVMGLKGDIMYRELSHFSDGERKKIELSLSFIKPFDFMLWDEPLNSIDLTGREQLEEVILQYKPTILFIEHDRYFIEKIATGKIELK